MRVTNDTGTESLPCNELSREAMRAATSKLGMRILTLLADGSLHSSQIARILEEPEQKIYYHTRNLRDAGVIVVDRVEDTAGGLAKVLRLTRPSFSLTLKELEPWQAKHQLKKTHKEFISPFIADGKWNARIVVGSPHPHGPESARGRDASYAIDLALFLGRYLETPPTEAVVLDTELTSWKQNLIIIGGPVVNKASDKLNARSLIPYSTEEKAYVHKKQLHTQENAGAIVKMPNPFAEGKWILLITGKRFTGTKAAILTFLQQFDALCERRNKDGTYAAIVQGLDMDSDGVIDAVKVLD